MKISQHTINQYFAGELGPEELSAFEAALANDKLFRQEVERQQGILDAAVVKGLAAHVELEARIKNIHQQVTEKEAKRRRPILSLRWMAVAAAVLLLVFSTYLFLGDQDSSQELFAEYAQPPKMALTVKGDNTKALALAETAFNAGKYEEALFHFTPYTEAHPGDYLVILYKGVSHLYLDQFELAREDFQKVAESQTIFHDMGDWYWALALLKQEEVESCKAALQKLLKQPNFAKRKEAEALLGKLK